MCPLCQSRPADREYVLTLEGQRTPVCEDCWIEKYHSSRPPPRYLSRRAAFDAAVRSGEQRRAK
jgi:hypothetical protein